MSQRREMREGLQDVLVQLGASAETITERLGATGVRGTPNSPEQCVLARYLHAVVGGDRSILKVRVGRRSVRVDFVPLWARSIVLPLSSPLQRFIAAFDGGEIVSLIDEPRPRIAGGDEATVATLNQMFQFNRPGGPVANGPT